jgi:predicted short-subunit dehydrogenase-like oxidoreductase (DUF2520 family)
MTVTIIGAGKVGRALAGALRQKGWPVELRAARRGIPARPVRAALLILAVRDTELHVWAERLARARAVSKRTAVVHVSGVYGTEPLRALRQCCAGVGQAHPLLSFAGTTVDFTFASLIVDGDTAAVERAKSVARAIGMKPRRWKRVDRVAYHAAACLVANGAAALAAGGAQILELSGAPRRQVTAAIGPLLRSVADNVTALGLPGALTGPVRRGDQKTIAAHLQWLNVAPRQLGELYRTMARAQLPLSTALGEAAPRDIAAIRRLLARSAREVAR